VDVRRGHDAEDIRKLDAFSRRDIHTFGHDLRNGSASLACDKKVAGTHPTQGAEHRHGIDEHLSPEGSTDVRGDVRPERVREKRPHRFDPRVQRSVEASYREIAVGVE
jgi:hypothetical protein